MVCREICDRTGTNLMKNCSCCQDADKSELKLENLKEDAKEAKTGKEL